MDVAAGDVVVAATDGVWDNVFPEELAGVVDAAQRRGETPSAAAATVAQLALSRRAWAPCLSSQLYCKAHPKKEMPALLSHAALDVKVPRCLSAVYTPGA